MAKTKVEKLDKPEKMVDDTKQPLVIKQAKKTDSLVESLKEELIQEFGPGEEPKPDKKSAEVPQEEVVKSVAEPTTKPVKTATTPIISGPTITTKTRSKKYHQAALEVNKTQTYPVTEAVELAQKVSYSKFPGAIEVHINTTAKNLRGLASLPHTAGKKLRILAFGKDAATAGVDVVGNEETIEEINQGKINFDILVTTPDWMPKLAKVARILGPRSLMPNPKSGTITENLPKTVAELQNGKVEYKTEANGQVIHLAVGKTSQEPQEIVANLKVLYQTIGKSRVKKVTLAPTMGPGIKVDLASL